MIGQFFLNKNKSAWRNIKVLLYERLFEYSATNLQNKPFKNEIYL